MFSIVITEKSGAQRQLEFEAPELTIGRLEGNDLVLPRSNVSKRHAQLILKDDRYVVVDLQSTNGTYVNGRRISAPMVVRKGDKIYIGDFIVGLARSVDEQREARAPAAAVGNIRPPIVRPHVATNLGMSAQPKPPPGLPDEIDFEDYGDEEELDTVMGEPIHVRPVSRPPPPPPRPSGPGPAPPPASDGLIAPAMNRPAAGGASLQPRTTLPADPPVMSRPAAEPVAPEPRGVQPAPRPGERQAAEDKAEERPADKPAGKFAKPRPEAVSKPASAKPAAGPAETPRPADDDDDRGPAPARSSRPSFPPRIEDPESAKTSASVLAPSVRLQGALNTLMEQLGKKMDVKAPSEGAFPSEQESTLDDLIGGLSDEGVVGPDLDRRLLRESAICEAVGLGPLDRLLSNHAVREVVVDGPSRILANLGGELAPVSMFFSSEDAIVTIARRLLARAGKTLDDSASVQSGILPDGTQVELLLPPLAVNGPLITIRCPAKTAASADGLVTEGVMSTEMLDTLRAAMRRRDNVLVVGPPGAGVSLLLAALAGMAQEHERVVVMEQSPNMAIAHPQLLRLARSGTELSIEGVLGLATRLRYDRLVADDLQPDDALGMLLHASTGRGVLMGMRAASARSALQQLEIFSLRSMGGSGASLASLMSEAIRVVVHVEVGRDGARRVQQMTEVRPEGENIKLHTLFKFEGRFRATEHAAAFRD